MSSPRFDTTSARPAEPWRPTPLSTAETLRSQTLDTWRRQAAGVKRTTRVDWPLVLGDSWPPTVFSTPTVTQRDPNAQWLTVLNLYDELRRHKDASTLLRRAVEALRRVVGLERVAIFLLDESGAQLMGTWGTGADGNTTDERHLVFEVGHSHREAFGRAEAGVARWIRLQQVPLLTQTPTGTRVMVHGENVLIPIQGRQGSQGLVACDCALSGCTLPDARLMQTAVLMTMLSGLLEEQAQPKQAPSQPRGIIPEALRLMHDDLNLSRDVLAKRVGVSPGRLGKLFKANMGESVGDYRNHLRLERFMVLADPLGGNLLQAALDSGFGSYAQFHRVFRAQHGCSPRTYLKRRLDMR